MRKWFKRFLGVGALAGIGYALWRLVDEQRRTSTIDWVPQPFPSPPIPVPHETEPAAATETAVAPTDGAAWTEPVGETCPASHPVKAKLASGIYHVPGGQMYDRTIPDRCYRDSDAAAADGLRASKR